MTSPLKRAVSKEIHTCHSGVGRMKFTENTFVYSYGMDNEDEVDDGDDGDDASHGSP